MVLKAKLLAVHLGQYTTFIFEDVNRPETDEYKYISCVKLPNWQYNEILNISDIGYLEINYVKSGESEWYDNNNKEFIKYKYSNCYFINFIKENKEKDMNKTEFKF